jgi:hypothetical protein
MIFSAALDRCIVPFLTIIRQNIRHQLKQHPISIQLCACFQIIDKQWRPAVEVGL